MAAVTTIESGYRIGLVAQVTQLHMDFYARHYGFGQQFESLVAGGLAEFCGRLDRVQNQIWSLQSAGELLGSVAIDGEDLGAGTAHLRWFIVADALQGSGMGRRLLQTALDFVDAEGFADTKLWTFSGLHAARHLYEACGFRCVEEYRGSQWGQEVLEQCFIRPRDPAHRLAR
ncbi:MAG: hypothetical protein RLZZ502_1931 [Pseudomonadota bacterium]|jgi:GNAT superfamily N-acetyltransferase